MMNAKLVRTIEDLISAVAEDYGLIDVRNRIRSDSKLGEDLGMDEVDIIAILCRAEEAFAIVLPDHQPNPSSTVADIVTLVADRLEEKQASLASCIGPTQMATHMVAQVRSM
jgi:acyl carrier protein